MDDVVSRMAQMSAMVHAWSNENLTLQQTRQQRENLLQHSSSSDRTSAARAHGKLDR